MILPAGSLNQELRIERPIANTALTGAGAGTWALVDTVRANLQDILPSRSGEQTANGQNITTNRTRVRIRYRTDVTPDMRFVVGGRTLQIVAGPAVIGNRQGLEFLAERYSLAGNGA